MTLMVKEHQPLSEVLPTPAEEKAPWFTVSLSGQKVHYSPFISGANSSRVEIRKFPCST